MLKSEQHTSGHKVLTVARLDFVMAVCYNNPQTPDEPGSAHHTLLIPGDTGPALLGNMSGIDDAASSFTPPLCPGTVGVITCPSSFDGTRFALQWRQSRYERRTEP